MGDLVLTLVLPDHLHIQITSRRPVQRRTGQIDQPGATSRSANHKPQPDRGEDQDQQQIP